MSKLFISFLGTNRYIPCNYYFNDEKVNNVHYVQEALIQIFCKDFTENDRILIFLTEKAKEKNWESNNNNESLLKNRLTNLGLKSRIIDILIPIGNSEKEIWDIFSIIYNNIKQNDEIILDVTHAFRSIPLLSIVLLNYARFLKNIEVKGIYYGAFEVLGSRDEVKNMKIEKRDAPIFDLTSFDKLHQWSIAADNFVNYGSSKKLCNLIYEKINPILAENSKNEQAVYMNKFAKGLNKITGYFNTARGKQIVEGKDFIYLRNNISNLSEDFIVSKPLQPIKEKIKRQIELYNENNILNGFRAVKWCIDNELIQQGITLLQETIITYILVDLEIPYYNIKNRDIVSIAIKMICEKKEYSQWPEKLKNDEDKTKKIINSDSFKLLAKAFDKLREYRNDINHGGYLKTSRSAGAFSNKLLEVYRDVEKLIFKNE